MLKNAFWLFIVAVVLLGIFLPSYTKWQDLEQTNLQYQQEIEDLKAKNTQLAREKRRLEEDPYYLEKVGREKMGLVKEGEVVYQIVPATQDEKNQR
jgi:cell division protein FtsB